MSHRSLPRVSRRRVLLAGTAGLLAPLAAPAAEPADAYPVRSIKLLIPFPAGGPSDIMARQVAQVMQARLGQSIYVENVPGAAGIPGTKQGASAPPDGYTLVLGGTGTHTTNEFLYSKLPYDADKDFIPIGLLYKAINVILVAGDSPFRTLQDLIRHAKANPGKLNYAVGAIGSSSHLAFEKLRSDAGLDIVPIPYKGMPAAYTDLLGGRVQIMPNDVLQALGQIDGGKVRPLAVTSAQRLRFLPDVPTVAESGFPGFEAIGWAGFFVPAGTPPPIVQKLVGAMRDAFADAELQRAFAQRKLDPTPMSQQEFATLLQQERVKWGRVIRAANIKLD